MRQFRAKIADRQVLPSRQILPGKAGAAGKDFPGVPARPAACGA
jgi:hypothetical protein